MINLHSTYASQGAYFVESLFQDQYYGAVTGGFLSSWKSSFGIPYEVWAEPDSSRSYGVLSTIPQGWIVDAETMNVLYYGNGVGHQGSGVASALAASTR